MTRGSHANHEQRAHIGNFPQHQGKKKERLKSLVQARSMQEATEAVQCSAHRREIRGY